MLSIEKRNILVSGSDYNLDPNLALIQTPKSGSGYESKKCSWTPAPCPSLVTTRRMDTQSTDVISTTQLSRAEYHAGLQCFFIHSCYTPFLCLAPKSFTCNASCHSAKGVLLQQHLTYYKHRNNHA